MTDDGKKLPGLALEMAMFITAKKGEKKRIVRIWNIQGRGTVTKKNLHKNV